MDYKRKQVVYSFLLNNNNTKYPHCTTQKKTNNKDTRDNCSLALVINGLFPAVVGVNMTLQESGLLSDCAFRIAH